MARSNPRPSCWKRSRSSTRTSSVTRFKAWNRRSSTTTRSLAKTCGSGARHKTEQRGEAAMYLIKKGNVPNQAHVGIPEGLCEEEHGRQGFVGPSSHLYRRHPPTGWMRIEGPLRPRAFACAALPTADLRSATADPLEALSSPDVRAFLARRAETRSYFMRNADGDEIYFVHAGRGRFETDYGVLAYEPGDYMLLPKRP